jgi:hypothetical protein
VTNDFGAEATHASEELKNAVQNAGVVEAGCSASGRVTTIAYLPIVLRVPLPAAINSVVAWP